MLLTRLRLLVVVLWAGSLWTVGYLVAPTLFVTLADRELAGTIAARMFGAQAWLSIGCALAMLLLVWREQRYDGARRRTLYGIVLAMLACTLVSHFGIQPQMEVLRASVGPSGMMIASAQSQFGVLHGVASVIYLIQSVLAGWLLFKQ